MQWYDTCTRCTYLTQWFVCFILENIGYDTFKYVYSMYMHIYNYKNKINAIVIFLKPY